MHICYLVYNQISYITCLIFYIILSCLIFIYIYIFSYKTTKISCMLFNCVNYVKLNILLLKFILFNYNYFIFNIKKKVIWKKNIIKFIFS